MPSFYYRPFCLRYQWGILKLGEFKFLKFFLCIHKNYVWVNTRWFEIVSKWRRAKITWGKNNTTYNNSVPRWLNCLSNLWLHNKKPIGHINNSHFWKNCSERSVIIKLISAEKWERLTNREEIWSPFFSPVWSFYCTDTYL